MAFNNIHGRVETYIAGADLSSKQYTFVKMSGADVVSAGDGEDAIGVLWNDPTSGKAASVVRGGDPHVYAGAAITAGADIASDAAGKVVPAATGDYVLGQARAAAAADGDLVQIHFNPVGTVA